MSNIQTIQVPHLGGITAAYQTAAPIDNSKPTLVLINSFTTTSDLYRDQFSNKDLASTANLLAIELLGHGQTRTAHAENWTYWDSAVMNLQVLEKLGVEKAFALGTSQGGWIAVRMALLAPEKILGVIPLGTSMDYESGISRELGCWNPLDLLGATISALSSSEATPEFVASDDFGDLVVNSGFGPDCPSEVREFWKSELKKNYQGDDGRKRMRMASINLRDRDGLYSRLSDVKCPVLWLQGTADSVYSVANAEKGIALFTNSPSAQLSLIEGGHHFLNASRPKEVDEHVLKFLKTYAN
ncbi:alpha/beta-hydrolase [Aaosphaeria arxii CBS 175.79]|uniref:Alpha/beta-hydrolase n=1 Tax=Aaosphaeria arxii CBS 175.79 TaxID=1450172 RepID=A0A6A5XWI9_9PLEO|nr:alpha/beta-hydrolase [Aaosphaeria arxii CBS 175.79]KAF2017316.1 alpha/beta-hydrolase [Aaosphaeria arxii CBS 175.79]